MIITRVNSNMNNATHGGRDNEATAIAGVVSKAIVGKPEFKRIIKIIDTIEYRADPRGNFQFHKT